MNTMLNTQSQELYTLTHIKVMNIYILTERKERRESARESESERRNDSVF
jgi:hypothetical protein